MSSPKGKWKLVGHVKPLRDSQPVERISFERWEREEWSDDSPNYEWHFHLPNGETIVFCGWGDEKVKWLRPQPPLKCLCGALVDMPDGDRLGPFPDKSWDNKVVWRWLKHIWEHHRSDYPQEIKNITQFQKWLKTAEGKTWEEKVYQKYHVLGEAEDILQKGAVDD